MASNPSADVESAALGLPLVERLPAVPDVEQVFWRLAARPHCLFLDSARVDAALGRYSFLAADPFLWLERPTDSSGALGQLERAWQAFRTPSVPGLPPFQGGAAGLFAYDLARQLETLPQARYDEFAVPALAVGFYDVVLAIDLIDRAAWIISQGFPETDPECRRRRAAERLAEFRRWLSEPVGGFQAAWHGGSRGATGSSNTASAEPVPPGELAPQYPVLGPSGLTSNFSRDGYLRAVERAIEYIRAGDIFQVNLAQRLLHPARDDSVELYLRLRRRNPATFAGYLDLGTFQIVSASPERFLRVEQDRVETRPIKGTRQRTAWPEADLFAGDELRASDKDRAENVMIVDLLRNDLARVCRPESIRVTQLCRVETYEFVQHLVSAVVGRLADGRSPLDLLRAAFPGGSITGAPKIRAMQIIAEIEPTARGAYCGALGYLGFDGSLDTSILIRTITAGRGWWQAPVGGGVVVQSTPEREYDETWHKAIGLLHAML